MLRWAPQSMNKKDLCGGLDFLWLSVATADCLPWVSLGRAEIQSDSGPTRTVFFIIYCSGYGNSMTLSCLTWLCFVSLSRLNVHHVDRFLFTNSCVIHEPAVTTATPPKKCLDFAHMVYKKNGEGCTKRNTAQSIFTDNELKYCVEVPETHLQLILWELTDHMRDLF